MLCSEVYLSFNESDIYQTIISNHHIGALLIVNGIISELFQHEINGKSQTSIQLNAAIANYLSYSIIDKVSVVNTVPFRYCLNLPLNFRSIRNGYFRNNF